MNIKSCNSKSFGKGKSIRVPGSKSHTIRALILACMSEGKTQITNPLKSADALSTAKAIAKLGASVEFCDEQNIWNVNGAGKNFHLPDCPIDVGNSGSLMYFISPVLATLNGRCVITGDESIQKRPVAHLTDALSQLGASAFCQNKDSVTPPFEFTGPISNQNELVTEGKLSQYISGFMMAATRLKGTTRLNLTTPQETPYLSMTKYWLDKYGVKSTISEDYKKITVDGSVDLKAHDVTIPSDWEAVAFPLIAALIANEHIVITDIDDSGTQGDEKIVELLQAYGADIIWDKAAKTLEVNAHLKASDSYAASDSKTGATDTSCDAKSDGDRDYKILRAPNKQMTISMAAYPDAICALCVIACFAEGTTVFTDIDICRKKETDRIKVMTEILSSLGAEIKDNGDTLVINGHSPFMREGANSTGAGTCSECCGVNNSGSVARALSKNPAFVMHGGKVDSYLDHRVAMSLACYGLFLPESDPVIIKDAECCDVSFPGFFDIMNKSLGTEFAGV
ncbi:3-phosphoshikimate 1-carboxyvinyltransferase [Treponema sp.]|uniref:3-phosphoshikimate 1-carboxyvinyltransferase n=1 Tax=Treponema sp. TaxID=166 RepID=UPI00298E6417|nr:3-phosphoshikimate 1-carboxyvinyltransferase [Treponema sp.]MCR5613906.1 3-phosphoshikimate 1-carboxyvinyltransferase [Treponema sp.]